MPEGTAFATKPAIAAGMLRWAVAAEVPFAWVAADSVYGTWELEDALRRAGKGYVLGVTGSHQVKAWDLPVPAEGTAAKVAGALPPEAWARLPAGQGTKGPRLYDWAYLELAHLGPGTISGPEGLGTWTRGLLVRRVLGDGALAYFAIWCPKGTPLATLALVEGRRWAIEDAFETAKTELGLDHNETRSWHGWHRHVTLVMLAFALLAVVRHKADALTPPQKTRSRVRPPSSAGRCRRSVALPAA